MIGFRRKPKTPQQSNLERRAIYAVSAVGKHYGYEAAYRLVGGLFTALGDPTHPITEAIKEANRDVNATR